MRSMRSGIKLTIKTATIFVTMVAVSYLLAGSALADPDGILGNTIIVAQQPFVGQAFVRAPVINPFFQQPVVNPFFRQPVVNPFFQQPVVNPFFRPSIISPFANPFIGAGLGGVNAGLGFGIGD
jgi:hypothetical protein